MDPKRRTLGQFFQDEIASPLGIDCYIRLPESIPNARLARVASASLVERLVGLPFRFAVAAVNPRSNFVRALAGSMLCHDRERIYARNFEVPSGGAWRRHAALPAPTACSRPAGMSSACAWKRWPP